MSKKKPLPIKPRRPPAEVPSEVRERLARFVESGEVPTASEDVSERSETALDVRERLEASTDGALVAVPVVAETPEEGRERAETTTDNERQAPGAPGDDKRSGEVSGAATEQREITADEEEQRPTAPVISPLSQATAPEAPRVRRAVLRQDGREKRRRTVYLAPALDEQLDKYCADEGREVSWVVTEALRQLLNARTRST